MKHNLSTSGGTMNLQIKYRTQRSSNGAVYETATNKNHSKNGGTKQTMKLTVGINYGYGKTYNQDSSEGGSLNFRLKDTRLWTRTLE